MGFLDNVTGKSVADKVETFSAKMEGVYAAMATRMIEVLDKEERLKATQQKLAHELANVNQMQRELTEALAKSDIGKLDSRLGEVERVKDKHVRLLRESKTEAESFAARLARLEGQKRVLSWTLVLVIGAMGVGGVLLLMR